MMIKRGFTALMAIAMAGAMAVTNAAPASADNFDGNCQTGEACLWDNTGPSGSHADFWDAVSNYGGWHFWNSPYWLANNVEAVENNALWSCLNLWDNANYSGVLPETIALMSGDSDDDLGQSKNRIESHSWTSSFPVACDI
jgi:hypothetical protein